MSHAPTKEEEGISVEYKSAWDATRILTIQEGFSWSGSERNHLFLNIGGGHFADVSMVSACNCIGDGRAVATLDWDDDGKLDFVLKNRTGPRLQLFHNRYPGEHNYFVLELQGNGTTCNRDAIGAHVEARLADGRTLHSTLFSSDGFLAQSSKRIHLGLGDAAGVEQLTIRWPDGTQEVHENLPANTRLRIVQGGTGPVPLAARSIPAMADLRPRKLHGESNVKRAVLAAELPLSALPLPSYDDPERTVADLAGRPVLINLWQRTCVACLKELYEFKQRAPDIRATDLRIVALNADTQAEAADTRKKVAEYGLALDAGVWNEDLEKAVEVLYGEIFGERSNFNMALPTSFLLDSQGNLAVVYTGRLDVDQLLADVRILEDADIALPLDRLSGGHRLIYRKRSFTELAERFKLFGLPALEKYYRQVDKETESFFFEDGRRRTLGRKNAARTRQDDAQRSADQGASASLDSVSESRR